MGILNDAIRAAVERDGRTRYALAKASGVDQATLSRWWSGGQGLSLDAAEKLLPVLGLTVTKAKATKTPAKRAGGKARL